MQKIKDIFALDIGIPRKNITFIPQPEFHIDMHMRPLRPGEIMLNDFDENIKLIDKALLKPDIKEWEKKELKSMKENSLKMKKVMQPVMDEIKKTLELSGIKVIKSPGVMEGKMTNQETRKVNFLNAVPGTTKGTNTQFYITNYTSIKPLRESFIEYMKSLGIEKIYWVGDDGGGEHEHSTSEQSLELDGGLDCRENH